LNLFHYRQIKSYSLLLAIVVYPILFFLLHEYIGNAVIILSAIPIFLIGYFYGCKCGAVAALVAMLLNFGFIYLAGVERLAEVSIYRFVGLHLLFILGTVMLGYAHNIHQKLSRELEWRKEAETELHYLANYDSLTDVANRRYGDEVISATMARAQQEPTRFALLFIDLNDFKSLNDDYGHHAGDLVLQEVAKRLKKIVGDQGVVIRNGGDEFLILLESIPEEWSGQLFVKKIESKMHEPMTIGGQNLTMSLSCGFAKYPEDAEDPKMLLKIADERMYAIKRKFSTV